MPVRKYRSIEEMQEVWYHPGDPVLYRTIARVWEQGRRTLQARFPPGVYKHRSIEEMNRLQEIWNQLNFQAFQSRRTIEKSRMEARMGKDPKTQLKELADKGELPKVDYETRREGGTDHEPAWTAEARLPDGRCARGNGRSKVEAEQNATAALMQDHKIRPR